MSKVRRISSAEAIGAFVRRGTCSEALLAVLNRAWGHPLPAEEKASAPLAGGIVQHGRQCGMVWGAALAAGAEAHRRFGAGPRAEAMATLAAARALRSFRALNGATDCQDITGINSSTTPWQMAVHFLLKGGTIRCFGMSGRYAPLALADIEAAFAQPLADAPAAPASCAGLLARRLGASEAQATMAAGLAGGVGLSGGGCGALGAAIWLGGWKALEDGREVGFKSRRALDALDRFLQCSGGELACAAIVGREFADIADHARFVRDGGCANLIAALAASAPS